MIFAPWWNPLWLAENVFTLYGGGGKGKKSYVVGYYYYMGVQISCCHGPVDAVTEIIFGERSGWSGSVTASQDIYVNNPELFGGKKREGGVQGYVSVMMGEATQGRNGYLASYQGGNCPAYRGLLSLVFKSFMWSAMNPYFKSPWVRVRRILADWKNGTVWYPEKAQITAADSVADMNPAHIIYQCLTDDRGLGHPVSDLHDASFRAAADTLHTEGFGLSISYDQTSPIENFIQSILDHINGVLRMNPRTGLFELSLIRADYDVEDLLELTPANVLEMKSFQRLAYGELANEIVVNYRDRQGDSKPIAAQDLASIQVQGAVISATRDFPGIRTSDLAGRVAQREVVATSAALARLTMTVNRDMWDKLEGDVVAVTWPDLDFTKAPFRIIDINKGTLKAGAIEVELVEDVFGLDYAAYNESPDTDWEDTATAPAACDFQRAVEAPYYEVATSMARADFEVLIPDWAFGVVLASPGAGAVPFSFILKASSDGVDYKKVDTGHFSPNGTLTVDIGRTETELVLANDENFALIDFDEDENIYGYLGDECVAIEAWDIPTSTVTVRRGVLDTVPMSHAAGERLWVAIGIVGLDGTERTDGETVYYKAMPQTSLGAIDEAFAVPMTLTMQNRGARPYPPGQFKINGDYWPSAVFGTAISASWSHRDRLQQTAGLIDHSFGDIGPEPGSTYTVRIHDGATLKGTYSAIAGTVWTYPEADQIAHGALQSPRITLGTEVAGLESLYQHDFTIERHGLGMRLGAELGGTL